jgi:FkbM family methyltransferase
VSAPDRLLSAQRWQYAIRKRLLALALSRVPIDSSVPTERIGSDYGGWAVPLQLVEPDWVVYGVGAGGDVSFDIELIDRTGCTVHVFDPTPASADYVRSLDADGVEFAQVALWLRDEPIELYPPRGDPAGSWSAVNLQSTDEAVRVPGRTLKTLMDERGHDRVDLLKVDIEGAEWDLISAGLLRDAGVRVFCVDLHPNVGPARAGRFVGELISSGFTPIARDEFDLTFLRGDDSH